MQRWLAHYDGCEWLVTWTREDRPDYQVTLGLYPGQAVTPDEAVTVARNWLAPGTWQLDTVEKLQDGR